MFGVANHAVVKSCTNRQQHIAMLHGHVGLVGAMHAGHANELLVCGWIGTQTHQGVGDGGTEQLDQTVQLSRCVRENHAATRVDHWALGLQQHLNRFLDLALMPLDHRCVGSHGNLGTSRRILAMGDRDVLGNIDQDRSGTPGAGDVEGLAHRFCKILDITYQEVVLDTGTRDPNGVTLLERILADRMRGDLPTDDHHRDGVHVGGGDTRHRIGHARTTGDQTDPYLVGGACVGISSVHGSLLMANQDMLEFLLFVDGVVDVKHRATGITEDMFNALFGKATHDDVCAIQFHDVFL